MPKRNLVRLLTYNIHGCIGTNGQYDFRPILDLLNHCAADVVALQEVYDETDKQRQFLAALHESAYPHVAYGPTLHHPERGDYGNVLLSKWPLKNLQRIDLSVPGREPRGAIRATIEMPSLKLDLTATHLGLSRTERNLQLAILFKRWGNAFHRASLRRPLVLMGDLNEWLPRSSILSKLENRFGATASFRSFPSTFPLFSLDHIFARPRGIVQTIGTEQSEPFRYASDHLPLVAELAPRRWVV
ncbi:endonuclease/exonuclease/phosphatase family protein [Pelagicoccus sp. SDUM812003]|uniref:endonuclease/exonuclease/phosphatase family protein n=1 Tax=Pelagicoccus sp. SDUM812003 TaxID=3041267 RepID=UPI00280D2273|nr:endonuclease/exonuclease/phosphatase family protein [Pelagicoccus sp. SDUM812003]MDQ8205527.1 endonuclease/exonuclease/phosphatase family protein [Pelagicoccus sp. SDUM812003]